MSTMTGLQTSLLDLLYEIKDTDIKLIIGGGYGIYLKGDYVRQNGLQTLFKVRPESRSTNDLDLFLRPELIIQSSKLRPLAEAITKLGYTVIKGAEKYQFVKSGPGGAEAGSIKIDILTGPEKMFEGTNVETDERRARPNPSVGIHAHPVNEAPTLKEGLLVVPINGTLSSGTAWKGEISLPHPYTYLTMKLFAFRDRRNDPRKELGSYHALDLYTILANTTETEWIEAKALRDRFSTETSITEARHIVSDFFLELGSLGMLRLRESPYYRPEFQLTEFMSTIQELFPRPN